jgi:hypothetical protein
VTSSTRLLCFLKLCPEDLKHALSREVCLVHLRAADGAGRKELAFRHVIDGRRIVARQRERVEMLARNGCDTTEAKRTLDLFARTLNIFEDDLRKILVNKSKKDDR